MASIDARVAQARVAFKGPGLQVNGLEAVSDALWLCDQQDNHSYLVDLDGGVLRRFPSPARNASGISVGAGSVWVASNVSPAMVFRHELQSGLCTAYLTLPGEGGVHGLQWRPDGGPSGSLWAARPGAQRLDHVDAESGELLGSIPFPLPRAHGLFWDEGALQVVETNGGRVFRLDPGTGQVLDEWRVEGGEAHGFSRSADGRIWLGDAETNTVLVIEP